MSIDAQAPGLFRQTAPETSKAAARSITRVSGTMRAQVYEAIKAAPDGLTDEEGERITGLRHQTYSARRNELARRGWIQQGGTRKTSSGRSANVWKINGSHPQTGGAS